MKTNPSTEFVLLGALFSEPKHGYQIIQFLQSSLESTWQVSTSQLYVLLRRLEKDGLLQSRLKTQEMRPSKRIFSLSVKGKNAFLKWLKSPVEHIRDLRIEFLAKLFFSQRLSLSEGSELVEKQLTFLKKAGENLKKNYEEESDSFNKMVYEIKWMTIDTWKKWLQKHADNIRSGFKTSDQVQGSREAGLHT
jgi:PadR family transcriptional regulator AphA